MALTLGSVTVSDAGVVTKSGECETLYDLLYADVLSSMAEVGAQPPTGPASAALKRGIARSATTIATYVHGLLTSRAKARIATTDSGLQRMPASTAEDTNTKGPAAEKLLSIV